MTQQTVAFSYSFWESADQTSSAFIDSLLQSLRRNFVAPPPFTQGRRGQLRIFGNIVGDDVLDVPWNNCIVELSRQGRTVFARLNLPAVAVLNCCLPFGLPPKETVRRTEVVIIQFRLPHETAKNQQNQRTLFSPPLCRKRARRCIIYNLFIIYAKDSTGSACI